MENTDMSNNIANLDNSNELKNLFQLARQARDNNENKLAYKYYSMISDIDPDSWEAVLYLADYTMLRCQPSEIESASKNFVESIRTVLAMIKNLVENRDEQILAVKETAHCIHSTSEHFFNLGALLVLSESEKAVAYRCCNEAYHILLMLGDIMDEKFGDYEELHEEIVKIWRSGIGNIKSIGHMFDILPDENIERTVQEHTSKIHKHDSSYQPPSC